MLTKSDLEQIKKYLGLYGRKDSQLPPADIPLDKYDQVAIVQKGSNRLVPITELQETMGVELKKNVCTYNWYISHPEKINNNTIYVCTTDDGSQVIQIYLQSYPFMPTADAEFSFSLSKTSVFVGETNQTVRLTATASPIASDIKFYDGSTLLASTTDGSTLTYDITIDNTKTFIASAHILGTAFSQNRTVTAVKHIYWGASATDAVLNTSAMFPNDREHYSAQNVPFNLQATISNVDNDYIYLEIPNEWQLNKIELYDNPSFPTELGMTQITTPRDGYKAYKSNYDRAVGEHVYRIFIKSV